MLFFVAVSFVMGKKGLGTLLLFLYVTEEAGRKCVRDMPWPPAAECNMITNKQTKKPTVSNEYIIISDIYPPQHCFPPCG
jgi:hypothetical protein